MSLKSKILLHVFFWMVVEATWYQHLYFHGQLQSGELEWIISTHVVHITTFYTFYFTFASKYSFKKTTVAVTGIFVVIFLLISFLRYYGLKELYQSFGSPNFFSHMHTFWSATFETFMFGIHATFIALIESRVKFDKLKKELREQNIKSEMALLRSQINPHFLYNTLNNIYSLAYPESVDAAQAVMKLSDIMRYGLTEANHKFVPLQKEIDYLESYISLEKIRYRDSSFIKLSVIGEVGHIMITPMLFIPFVENAFKHGVVESSKSLIQIQLNVENKTLYFEVINDYSKNSETPEGSGIGLRNVQRRLELIYPKKHELILDDDKKESKFKVKLKISF